MYQVEKRSCHHQRLERQSTPTCDTTCYMFLINTNSTGTPSLDYVDNHAEEHLPLPGIVLNTGAFEVGENS